MTASATLTRPRTERMLFGVCAGFARYLDLDVTLVRVLFVILALAGGAPACSSTWPPRCSSLTRGRSP